MAKYDASSIKVLEYPENVRRKYGMYIGDNDDNGIRQIWGEVVGNSLDECASGYNYALYVNIGKNEFVIADEGRGIPVEKHKETGISTLTTVLTKLHAGAKIDTDNTSYKASIGTFGVGVSVTNALSEYLEVWTFRKSWFYQKFIRGIAQGKPEKVAKPPVFHYKKGTVIRFKSDSKIFGNSTFPAKSALEWLRTISYFYPQVEFKTEYKKKTKTFQHKGGINELCAKLIKNMEVSPIGDPFYYKDDNLDLVLQWSDGSDDNLISYVNGFRTTGGTHLTALNKIILDVFNKAKLKKQEFQVDNLKAGLIGVLNVTIPAPLFASQTKERLLSKEGATAVLKSSAPFSKWAIKNKAQIKQIIAKAVELNDLESEFAAKKKLASNSKTQSKGKTLLPSGMLEAKSKNRKDVELFLVEGDSAKGSARLARDANIHAILPLKGKIINAINSKDDKLAANKEVISIIKAIGYNPTLKNPYAKLRAGRLIFLSDADPDGFHISLLYSSVVFKLLRQLFKLKMVYYVRLPLYTCTHKDKRYFADTLADIKKQVPSVNSDRITRMKGLGEVDPDVLRTIAFNPDTRKLVRIKYKEGARLRRYLATLHSENSFRKDLLNIQPRLE